MFLDLQNAIHVTLYIIRRAFISLSSKQNNVHKNVKCSRFECPYCKTLISTVILAVDPDSGQVSVDFHVIWQHPRKKNARLKSQKK